MSIGRPEPLTCIRDFTTSAGKIVVHKAAPPTAPENAVRRIP